MEKEIKLKDSFKPLSNYRDLDNISIHLLNIGRRTEAELVEFANGRIKLSEVSAELLKVMRKDNISLENDRPPAPPLMRVMREGGGNLCTNCNSTSSRLGFMGWVGELSCDNIKCKNNKR